MILLFYVNITLIIIAYLLVEKILLNFRLSKTPVRILINGTRGKTTTVKILHRLFNKTGRLTISKTTGDVPQIHYPDGKIRKLFRIGPANIIENVRQINRWFRNEPQVFIIEGMAIQPEMQYILSHKIFRPTHLAFTNILRDHAEAMGESRKEVAACLMQSVTKEVHAYLPKNIGSLIPPDFIQESSAHFFQSLPYSGKFPNIPPQIIADSWGLINSVGQEFQLDKTIVSQVFSEIWHQIDRSLCVNIARLNIEIFDLFSINDIDSAILFVEHIRSSRAIQQMEIVVLNTRADRPLRTRNFIDYLQKQERISEIWITGSGRYLAKNHIKSGGISNRIRLFNRTMKIKETIMNGFSHPARIVGLANHSGIEPLLDELRKLS